MKIIFRLFFLTIKNRKNELFCVVEKCQQILKCKKLGRREGGPEGGGGQGEGGPNKGRPEGGRPEGGGGHQGKEGPNGGGATSSAQYV